MAIKFNIGKTHATPKTIGPAVPGDFDLSQNYPNPFNPSTTIAYALPEDSYVTLRVTDAFGRTVATLVDGNVPAGEQRSTFNASDLASGVYYYTITMRGLSSGTDFTRTMKMLLTK